jgi:hypothetical protein
LKASHNIKHDLSAILRKELIRRSLNQYFQEKGYDNFLVSPYPPTLVDLPDRVPMLMGLVEIAYSVNNINMANNMVDVVWNVFVLGNKRIFVGKTSHDSFSNIENSINDISNHFNGPLTIEKIIEIIVEFLGDSEAINGIENNGESANTTFTTPAKPIPNWNRKKNGSSIN